MSDSEWIRSLHGRRKVDGRNFGNKASALWVLSSQGFLVPDGFAISWPTLAARFGTPRSPSRSDITAHGSKHTTQSAPSALSSSELELTIADRAKKLARKSLAKSVIVRSSAVAEDGFGTSFAGIFTSMTVPKARTADVLTAVEGIYSSCFSERARHYWMSVRPKEPFPLSGGQMGILLQQYVDGEVGGVCFTRDPRGREGVLAEIAKGGATTVASGCGSSILLRFTESHRILEGNLAELADLFGGDLEKADHLVASLAQNASRIRAVFGTEQDIEWLWANGEIWILQARPITGP